jgi:hypothetical protein
MSDVSVSFPAEQCGISETPLQEVDPGRIYPHKNQDPHNHDHNSRTVPFLHRFVSSFHFSNCSANGAKTFLSDANRISRQTTIRLVLG